MLNIANKIINSRLLLGTAGYPSLDVMQQAITASRTEVITVALKRQLLKPKGGQAFWNCIKKLGVHILPNTAGCHCIDEVVATAQMARELFETNWIKLEVIGDEYNLQPDLIELPKAAKILIDKGFEVLPYCTDDFVVCQRLVDTGCRIVMPWGSPIGSGLGLMNPYSLRVLRERFPKITLIIDAGIGKPSDATRAMEMGFDAILLNSAVAKSLDPIQMASAFRDAITAGRSAYKAGFMPQQYSASPSTPLIDTPFWQQEKI